jgi:hypothetical protein
MECRLSARAVHRIGSRLAVLLGAGRLARYVPRQAGTSRARRGLTLASADEAVVEPANTARDTGHGGGHISVLARGDAAEAVILGDVAAIRSTLGTGSTLRARGGCRSGGADEARVARGIGRPEGSCRRRTLFPGGLDHIARNRSGFDWVPLLPERTGAGR